MAKFEVNFTKQSEVVSDFLKNFGAIFQTVDYLSIVSTIDGFLTIKKEDLIAVLPLAKTKKNHLTAYHIPPYTHLFGPVIHPNYQDKYYEIVDALLTALPHSGHYDFKIYLNEQDVIPWLVNGFTVTTGQTFVVPDTLDYSIRSIHSSKRRDLKKLMTLLDDSKITIKEGKECFKDLLYLQELTGQRGQFKIRKETLKNILWQLPDVNKFGFVVYDHNEEPISGTLCPYDKITTYLLINASKRINDKILNMSGTLTSYLAVKKANEMGLSFDFEGSSIPGVAKFYRMMGGQPRLIYRAQKSPSLYYRLLRSGKNYIKQRE